MNPRIEWGAAMSWLLTHSLEAGVLVLLVLAVQWLFRRRLTSRWRFALWWIVLARLLLPFNPESALSLFNFVRPAMAPSPVVNPVTRNASPPSQLTTIPNRPVNAPPQLVIGQPMEPTPSGAAVTRSGVAQPVVSHLRATLSDPVWFEKAGAAVWLGGVLMLGVMVAIQTARFHRRLAEASTPASPALRELLQDCQREFGIRRKIALLETDAVRSPALFGLWRLRLLLPPGTAGRFSTSELRYIFLHELAHVKRGDLWLNWLVTLLQALHWFNPLLWLGFARLRADRELACDELALLRAGDQAGTAYGATVVKLLEGLSRPAAIPGLVGILEDRKQMRRRIVMIVNFRRPGRRSVLAVLLVGALAAVALTDAQSPQPRTVGPAPPNAAAGGTPTSPSAAAADTADAATATNTSRPDLRGTVVGPAGDRLSAPATVFIATAAPKTGTSTFCPGCYPDCIKSAQADAQGNFIIPALDPQLTFQILVVAKGYQPTYVNKLDPVKGMPAYVQLQPIAAADAAPDRCLHGRVVNAKGEPLAGAVVDRQGVRSNDGGGGWGRIEGVDPLAVTDEHGDFMITAKKHYDSMDLKISARGYADKPFTMVPVGVTNQLVMTEGATVTGRVLLNGRPLAHVGVGISGTERQAGSYLGHYEIGTGDDGRFAILNVPPDADFCVYSLMDTMEKSGAVPLRNFRTAKDGATVDLGDLTAAPTHRLAGRVKLADGATIPATTRLLVSRDQAWDSRQFVLDPDGGFEALGVPDEIISLSVRVAGYHISGRNRSLDSLNPFRLIGRVDRDITNLVVLLDAGPQPPPDYGHSDPLYNDSRDRTLAGAEGGADHSSEWRVTGHVMDADTKEPIAAFTVTPGSTENFSHTAWNSTLQAAGKQGAYTVYVKKRYAGPMLKVEADGYLPQAHPVDGESTATLDFFLKKGSGPAGRVLLADGSPATNATLVLLGEGNNQAGLRQGELQSYRGMTPVPVRADGTFSFKPTLGARTIVAASTNGFASVSLDSFATNSTIILQPFGTIEGTLQRPNGPGTNELLDVHFDGDLLYQVSLNNSAVTDAQGRFRFDQVPPGHLVISYRVMMAGGNGWTTPELQRVNLKPGQNLAVAISAPARQTNNAEDFRPQPSPKMIPGQQIAGTVLNPDGQPAADADVALLADDHYVSLRKGALSVNPNDPLFVHASSDGRFTLPLCENVKSVVAVNESGYGQVTLEQLKANPQIRLQKWGRIEGTLRLGHQLGTNEIINASPEPPRMLKRIFLSPWMQFLAGGDSNAPVWVQPPYYDLNAFAAKTDEHGHFSISYLPPGMQSLLRRVPITENSWSESPIAGVEVKPGETTATNIGSSGRLVVGRLKLADGLVADLSSGFTRIQTPTLKYYLAARELKTAAERQAYFQSPEVSAALSNVQNLAVTIAADGTFHAEGVPPGKYEISCHPNSMSETTNGVTSSFVSAQELTVPRAKDDADDSSVDFGTVTIVKRVTFLPASSD
jgi:beta-lactamase regulating signal transducer with metallopeptidase domain